MAFVMFCFFILFVLFKKIIKQKKNAYVLFAEGGRISQIYVFYLIPNTIFSSIKFIMIWDQSEIVQFSTKYKLKYK